MMRRTSSRPFKLHFSLPCHTKLYSFPVCVRNKPALAKRKRGTEEDPILTDQEETSQSWSRDLIATWKEIIKAQCMRVWRATSLYAARSCSPLCTDSNEMLNKEVSSKFAQKSKKEASLVWASITEWPRSEVSATVPHRCHGLLQIHSSKWWKPSLAC